VEETIDAAQVDERTVIGETTAPSCRLSMSALRSAENSCSTTARRDTTTLLRFWSSLMTLNSSGLFSR
jgi:hypothetical protein